MCDYFIEYVINILLKNPLLPTNDYFGKSKLIEFWYR